jgi:hypothetical protein
MHLHVTLFPVKIKELGTIALALLRLELSSFEHWRLQKRVNISGSLAVQKCFFGLAQTRIS